jgi:lysophospholipase L1-like esterase
MKTVSSKELLLLLVTVLITAVAAEMLVRFIHSAPPFQKELVRLPYLQPQDASLRWRFTAAEGRNSLGLKNREVGTKADDTFRIMFLGDSLIWTAETSTGELFTEIIEKNLNRRLTSPQQKIEVINAGIPGYTTYQELEFLKIYGLDMEPDLVILGFVFNDVHYKYLHRPTADKLLDIEADSFLHHFDTSTFPGVMFARSYLAHELYSAARRIINKGDRLLHGSDGHRWYPFEFKNDVYLAWKKHGWRETDILITEMKQLLDEKEIAFMAIVFPIATQVDRTYRGADDPYLLLPQARIGSILETNNIPYIDLTATLYDGGGKELFKDSLHLNASGNELIAEELTRYLIENRPFWSDAAPI